MFTRVNISITPIIIAFPLAAELSATGKINIAATRSHTMQLTRMGAIRLDDTAITILLYIYCISIEQMVSEH